MAEYKNTDEIVKNMTKKFDKNYGDTTIKGIRDVFNMCVNCVRQTFTADVVEAKFGEWVFDDADEYGVTYKCSRCNDLILVRNKHSHKPNYCGNCGADMRGGVKKSDL